MALLGIGCLLLAHVSVDDSYFGDIFLGLLIFGPGLGASAADRSIPGGYSSSLPTPSRRAPQNPKCGWNLA
ncbi:MAG: hypothetical protein WDZ66_12255 [Steroidobacteraceae bacterium]